MARKQTQKQASFFFKKKWANLGLFFIYFRSFQTFCSFFTSNKCEKCQVHWSIRCQDMNPRPLENESSPITTRPLDRASSFPLTNRCFNFSALPPQKKTWLFPASTKNRRLSSLTNWRPACPGLHFAIIETRKQTFRNEIKFATFVVNDGRSCRQTQNN